MMNTEPNKANNSSEPIEEKPFLTEDILRDEYRKVIEENLPFGFEYYEELFQWVISKYKEAYNAGGMPERILAKEYAEKANASIAKLEESVKYWQDQCRSLVKRRNEYESYLESELKALREEYNNLGVKFDKEIERWQERDVTLRKERDELKSWKESEMKIWMPVINYCQDNGEKLGIKLGGSISKFILELLEQFKAINTKPKS